MRFIWTKSLDSTQVMLADYVRSNTLDEPFVVATLRQTNGIGSRENTWEQVACGLYLSCALPISLLPNDLPNQSASIYFGQILLELFQEFHKDLWLKWPNDFYLHDYKVGGLITQFIKGCVVFGVGLNILSNKQHSLLTDINLENEAIANTTKTISLQYEKYNKEDSKKSLSQQILFEIIQKILHFLSFKIVKFDLQNDMDIIINGISCETFLHDSMAWCEVFRRYEKNFYKNYRFDTHINENGNTYKLSLQNAKLQSDGSIILHDKILYSLR